MGGRKETETFFRLFLIPGVHHGEGGLGLTDFDALVALQTWVEEGQLPEQLTACRSEKNVVGRCRPEFPYLLGVGSRFRKRRSEKNREFRDVPSGSSLTSCVISQLTLYGWGRQYRKSTLLPMEHRKSRF
jgi:hypothetical protein